MTDKRQFRAYYYEFTATGVLEVDQILMAVARAGKAFHHTEYWGDNDYDGKSPVQKIQEAANQCAELVRARSETFDEVSDDG